ncbi:MAG: heme ABC exporter ATP-binding protein CcmA [Chloroflexota bacterium]|nr:heme ABC exporter ATP-binding protein CcmA [Chloroflexota bacterium]
MSVEPAPPAALERADAGPTLPLVEARALTVRYGDVPVLRRVSLAIGPGRRLALLGPNGAGKSTLLRTLAGLVRPADGAVLLHGRRLADDPVLARRQIGFVGHESLLTPALTAGENLTYYARLYAVPEPARRVADVLEQVGLLHRANDLARTLSRGMTQRVALARALLHDPTVLLMDEPDAGLDVAAYAALRRTVLQPDERATILVTHSLEHAVDLCDSVAILDGGRLCHVGPLDGLVVDDLRRLYDDVTAGRRG